MRPVHFIICDGSNVHVWVMSKVWLNHGTLIVQRKRSSLTTTSWCRNLLKNIRHQQQYVMHVYCLFHHFAIFNIVHCTDIFFSATQEIWYIYQQQICYSFQVHYIKPRYWPGLSQILFIKKGCHLYIYNNTDIDQFNNVILSLTNPGRKSELNLWPPLESLATHTLSPL